MSEPVRMSAEDLMQRFGCSRRLATRIGALLGRQAGVSALVLEEAASSDALRDLLLERSLLDEADLAVALQTLSTRPEYQTLWNSLPLSVMTQGGVQTIVAEEEALAEGGFAGISGGESAGSGNPPSAYGAAAEVVSPTAAAQHVESRVPAVRQESAAVPALFGMSAGAGATEGAFSDQETARLRVEIFAGADSVRKVAALRQFAFTGVPAEEKARVFRQALADEDPGLRQAAVAGLRQFGADAGWVECLRLLSEGAEQTLALQRLQELTERAKTERIGGQGGARAGEVEAALLLLAGLLRDRAGNTETAETALTGLACVIPLLPAGFAGWGDLAGLLQERLLAGQTGLLSGCRAVFAAMEAASGGAVSLRLLPEIERTEAVEYRAILLDLVFGMALPQEVADRLLPLVVDTLGRLPLEHPSARFLRKAITDRAELGLRLMAEELLRWDVAHQRSFLRFADNALHSFPVSQAVREALAERCLTLLRGAPLQLRTDLIETRVLIRSDIRPELRSQAALQLLAGLRDYAHWPLCDYLENSFVGLGRPAVEPLLAGLREQKNSPAGAILARALGRIGTALPVEEEAIADDILRELSRLTFSGNLVMDSLHEAMGRLASREGVSEAVNALVMRTLLSRLTGTPADAALIRGLGFCAAGNVAPDCELPAIVGLCLKHLQSEQSAPSLQVATRDGEEVITFGDDVGIYAELIPASLCALEQVLLGRRTDAPQREELLTQLLALWEDAGGIRVQWGLANVTLLTEILGRVGESPLLSDRQRVMLSATLRKRAGSLPVLMALARVAAVPNRLPQMDKLAAALAIKALERMSSPESGLEDLEAYLKLLQKVCSRGRFEVSKGSVDRLWERIAQAVVECARQGVTGVSDVVQSLRATASFPEGARQILEDGVARLYSLSTRETSSV